MAPVTTTPTFRSSATVRGSTVRPLYVWTDAREITRSRLGTLPRRPINSSVTPSLRYSFSGSPVWLTNGSTATERAGCAAVARLPRTPFTVLGTRKAVAPRATMIAATAATRRARRWGHRSTRRLPSSGSPFFARSRAEMNSGPERNRSAGTLASAFPTTCSSTLGMVSRTLRIVGAVSTDLRARIACGVAPVNGGLPRSISYRTHPRL